MSIEQIRSTGMTYQAATSNVYAKQNTEKVSEGVEKDIETRAVDARTVDFTVKETKEGNSDSQDSSAKQEENRRASVDAVKKAVNEMNKTSTSKTVQFGVHEETNRMTIKILDKDSRKVIKEFPAEKTLDLIAKAWEMAGIMVDEKR
ncbi:MAG: flagellar protein FlaG [Lachnospiraceae bacterium]|nr:flagellar protein FlaG [Lachnospiraceae bacterium]